MLRRGRNEFLETMWLAARRSRRCVDNQQEKIEIQPARRKDSIDPTCYMISSSPDSECTEDNLPFQDEQASRTFNRAGAPQNHNPVPTASYVDFMVVISMDRSAAGEELSLVALFVKILSRYRLNMAGDVGSKKRENFAGCLLHDFENSSGVQAERFSILWIRGAVRVLLGDSIREPIRVAGMRISGYLGTQEYEDT